VTERDTKGRKNKAYKHKSKVKVIKGEISRGVAVYRAKRGVDI
jgi:hypothetical protein